MPKLSRMMINALLREKAFLCWLMTSLKILKPRDLLTHLPKLKMVQRRSSKDTINSWLNAKPKDTAEVPAQLNGK